MLGAGLKGIEDGLELMPEATNNIFDMSPEEMKDAGIATLPSTLGEAIELFEQSEAMKEILGEHIHEYFVRAKRAEWTEYQAYVSQWELDKYLPIL
jgi:glutamine synthetase